MTRTIFSKVMWAGRATPAAIFAAVLLWVVAALLVLGTSAPEASAAGKPDLVVSRLSNLQSPLEPGQKFRATSTTKNAGQARAAASTTRFYLSRDRLKGTGDVRFAAGQSVGTLGVGKSARATTTLTVPSTTPIERSYYLIACADDLKKVGESRETNNCRASAEGATVAENPFKTAPEFDFAPNSLTVSPTLQGERAVTKTIPTGGGTATATDGTEYTLTLPQGALLSNEEITMTPVSGASNLPMSGGLKAGVDIKPDGLRLHKPATLTIIPPAGTEVPLEQQTGLSWHGGGEEFHLYALEGTQQLTFELSHFSAYGVGSATDAERAAAMERMPTRTADQYRQATSELLRQEREAQLNGEAGDPQLEEKLADSLAGYYRDVVRPKMLAAETDDALAESAIQEGVGWSRQVELLGLGGDPYFAQKEAEVMDSVLKILQNAFDKAFERCVTNNDPSQAVRLLALERMAQLMGVSLGDVFDKLDRCVRFELDFQTDMQEESNRLATSQVRVMDLPLRTNFVGQVFGSKDLQYQSWDVADTPNTDPCINWTPAHLNIYAPQFHAQLLVGYNFREEMGSDGRTIRTTYPPDIELGFSPGGVYEYGTYTGIGGPDCSSGSGTVNFSVYNSTIRNLYPFVASSGGYMVRDWSFSGTEAVWARKQFDRSFIVHPLPACCTRSEQTTFEVRHTPAL